MSDQRVQRLLIAATGTGVGKTHVARLLVRALRARFGDEHVVAMKPVESGAPYDDARALGSPAPRYALPEPLSPHLAARRAGVSIELGAIAKWVEAQEAGIALSGTMLPYPQSWSVIETAGGVLSPLAPGLRNFELMRALDPSRWILVAPDRLGVLHDLAATLTALAHLGREPDYVVLSTPSPDASSGTNAAELRALGIAGPALVLGHGAEDVGPLVELLAPR
jgi:dethiobiotin synthetase